MFEFLFATGLRIQEALAAEWERIDREARTIPVVQQVKRSGEFALPKGKKIRTAVVLPSWWCVQPITLSGPASTRSTVAGRCCRSDASKIVQLIFNVRPELWGTSL